MKTVTEINENKQKYLEENNIPKNANLLCCTNTTVKDMFIEGKWKVFVWKDNNTFNFCGASKKSAIRKTAIPIKDIKFYTRKGDYRIEAVTEGGGVSIGRAILGGIVGVIIGWIVGSIMDTFSDVSNFRIFTHSSFFSTVLTIVGLIGGLFLVGRNKVTTTNKEIDNRKTYLNYLENNETKRMIFTSKGYDELLKLIPEKEMSYIENNKIVQADKNKNENIYKDIEKLAELRDKGILTEEEFNQKKELLLDRI